MAKEKFLINAFFGYIVCPKCNKKHRVQINYFNFSDKPCFYGSVGSYNKVYKEGDVVIPPFGEPLPSKIFGPYFVCNKCKNVLEVQINIDDKTKVFTRIEVLKILNI